MRALKRVRNRIEAEPESRTSQLLAKLVLSLEGQGEFDVKDLYELDFNSFELALAILAEWRLDGHFSAKFRLMDASLAAFDLNARADA